MMIMMIMMESKPTKQPLLLQVPYLQDRLVERVVRQREHPSPDGLPQEIDNLLRFPLEIHAVDAIGIRLDVTPDSTLDRLHDTAYQHLVLEFMRLTLVVEGLEDGLVEALDVGEHKDPDCFRPSGGSDPTYGAEQHGRGTVGFHKVLEACPGELGAELAVALVILGCKNTKETGG